MNLTQPVRKANLKRWKAQGPAVIQSPLKALHARFPDLQNEKGEYGGENPFYSAARRAAQRGDGVRVKQLCAALCVGAAS